MKRVKCLLLSVALVISLPQNSYADSGGLLLLTTTTGLIALAGIGSYMLSKGSGGDSTTYLEEYQHDVQEGLATGEGKFVDDMMTYLGLPESSRTAFVNGLLNEYDQLSVLADVKSLDEERSDLFYATLIEIATQI